MTTNESTAPPHQQISRLAYLNWQKDGCHHGHDLDYWLEAEAQIKATRNILIAKSPAPTRVKSKSARSKANGSRKTSMALKARNGA